MSDNHSRRITINQAFQDELERLNPEQRRAVDQFEGPTLVLAGPGTGKTHILAARIGRILAETDTQPANILCLTFTDAGVLAMRRRLLQFIGPDAHRVHIYTFHSFCNSVIQDNLEVFGNQQLEPISDLERIDLIRELLSRLPVEHPLRRGHSTPAFYERHLHHLFTLMKKEDWSPDFITEKVEEYLADLENRPEYRYQRRHGPYRKGDLKKARIEEQVLRMERLKAAAALYPDYEKAKAQARRYDYEDMILWVIRAFEQDEMLLRTYQEKYLYLLVDEFQDTNTAQNELLLQLISYWEEVPNVFIVGDDDQSIYEFQGARLLNLIDFHRRYQEHLEIVLLTRNYRSAQAILDYSGRLIEHNNIRILRRLQGLDLQKKLVAAHPDVRNLDAPPALIAYPNRLQEVVGILRQIRALQDQGVPLSEIAVIYARHRQAEDLMQLLARNGVTYQTRRPVNILDTPLIRKVLTLLQYCAMELERPFSADPLLFRILHFDFTGILPSDLARLTYAIAAVPVAERAPLRKVIHDRELAERLSLPIAEPIFRFAVELEGLLAAAANLPLPEAFERLINRTGLLAHVAAGSEAFTSTQLLYTFFQFLLAESRRDPELDMAGLLRIIQRMKDNHLPLALQETFESGEGVQLLTAHSAKGLEFDYVFMLDAVKDQWEPSARQSSFQFPLPDTLSFSAETDAMEARRRLFYVAMTRARKHLEISYAQLNDKGKELHPTVFLHELAPQDQPVFRERTIDRTVLLQQQLTFMQLPAVPSIEPPPRQVIDGLLEGFQLSISSLNLFLRCPLSFFYEKILKVPVLNSAAAAYGQAVHQALHRLFENMLRSKPREFPPESRLLDFFSQEMEKQRYRLSPQDYELREKMGRRHLQQYYRAKYGTWHRKVVLEYTVRQAEVEGVPVTGIMDKLEFHPRQQVTIVDYKTGKFHKEKIQPPTDKHPYGGSYWRQLVFYKLLYEHFDITGRTAGEGVIQYVDPDPAGQFPEKRIQFSAEDTALMKTLIRETYDRILRHDFYTGCDQEQCVWCTFTRDNQLPASLADPSIEALDDHK